MRFKFICRTNGLEVAKGEATATMAYEFQKAFLGFATSRSEMLPENSSGRFIKLESLFNRKVGEYDSWITIAADGREYYFFVGRLA